MSLIHLLVGLAPGAHVLLKKKQILKHGKATSSTDSPWLEEAPPEMKHVSSYPQVTALHKWNAT